MILELIIRAKDGTKGSVLRDSFAVSVVPTITSLFLSILSLLKEEKKTGSYWLSCEPSEEVYRPISSKYISSALTFQHTGALYSYKSICLSYISNWNPSRHLKLDIFHIEFDFISQICSVPHLLHLSIFV